MTPATALSIRDLRRFCQRRLPRVIFEGIESGVDDEHGLAWNEAAFQTYRFSPRHLVDVRQRSLETTLFGRSYASPFGICPMGIVSMFRRGGEFMLAEAASAARVPFVISGTSMVALEELARIDPENTWYQVYAGKDWKITEDFLRRAQDAGIGTLVLTVDCPVTPNRERDARNGFVLPPKIALRDKVEAIGHPAWLVEYLRHGVPLSQNWQRYAPEGATAQDVFKFIHTQHPSNQAWQDAETLRNRWPGKFVIKGLMHPADAVRCAEIGADGIVISNHGGKALDRSPAPIEVLSSVKAAVGDRLAVMMDSGIRRGSDIIVAKCLGADFLWVGRSALYGAVSGGTAGARRALQILHKEIDQTLALMGCPNFHDLSPDFLLNAGEPLRAVKDAQTRAQPAWSGEAAQDRRLPSARPFG